MLWVPPDHWLNLVRLFLVLLWGAVGLRETFQVQVCCFVPIFRIYFNREIYQYLDDPDCESFGRQSWVILAIVITEFLIVARFDWETITKPLPRHVLVFWICGIVILIAWTIWNFFIARDFQRNAETWLEEQRRRLRWLRAKSIELGIYSPEKKAIEQLLSNPNNVPTDTSSRSNSKSRRVTQKRSNSKAPLK